MPRAIVTSTYRYKPPPKRKGRKLAEITGPRIVTSVPVKKSRRPREVKATAQGVEDRAKPSTAPRVAANDDGRSAIVTVHGRKTVRRQREQQSAIVTARKQGKPIPDGLLPDTPEELERRRDAADALWRELVRRATGEH